MSDIRSFINIAILQEVIWIASFLQDEQKLSLDYIVYIKDEPLKMS